MGTTSMKAMMDELVGSAPKFFAERMVGASEQEISKLEAAAGTALSDGHRTLLHYLGGTEPDELDVFLFGRDLSVEKLLKCYEKNGPPLPGMVYFSYVQEQLLVLKHQGTINDDPFLGGFGWEDGAESDSGKFYFLDPEEEQHLEDYILMWLNDFRIAQPEFCVSWNGPKDCPDWSQPYEDTFAVLTQMGFLAIASHPTSTFLSRGLECTELFSDGSATMASDDMNEIKRIMAVLDDHTYIEGLHLKPANRRVRAPRE